MHFEVLPTLLVPTHYVGSYTSDYLKNIGRKPDEEQRLV
jgi:hypothetical protein